MAIKVTLVDLERGRFYDEITGTDLRGTLVLPLGGVQESADLTNQDCSGIIDGIADNVLYASEGYLGIVCIADSLSAPGNNVHNLLIEANRWTKKFIFRNIGSNDLTVAIDEETSAVITVKAGTNLEIDSRVPVSSLKVTAAASGSYEILVF